MVRAKRGRPRKRIWLKDLHRRHPGLTEGLSSHLCEAAAVCLSRFHAVPPATLAVRGPTSSRKYELVWFYPSATAFASNAHDDNATEHGAYAIALASVDAHVGLVTVGRTQARSGADWHLRPYDPRLEPMFDIDHPDAVRLEVSGISDDDDAKVRQRVRAKRDQASSRAGAALVGVVGFRTARVVFSEVRR